jgi:predicted MFS family arabinose efflux permease
MLPARTAFRARIGAIPAERRRQILLFFGATACLAAGLAIHESIFNNFLADTFSINADSRGWLEFPRELPGLLVVLMTGVLAVLPVTRLGLVGSCLLVCGLVGMAFFGFSWYPMLLMMILGSAGMHLLQPVQSSIALGLSHSGNRGTRLGQVGAVSTVGMIAGTGFVWFFFEWAGPRYQTGFLCAAALAGCTALLYGRMHIPHLHQRRARLVVRKKYWLYYTLELLFGARKQIFITFGPWVLIQVYGKPAAAIAGLLMIAAVIGIVFKPLAGRSIDRFGERSVLVADGLVLVLVCVGYGYATQLTGGGNSARLLASACFILDNLLFSLGAGRAVYVSRLSESPQELTSTLSLGVSINHIVSMTIPPVAGVVWVVFGYQKVFLAAAILAFGISAFASLVPRKAENLPGEQRSGG